MSRDQFFGLHKLVFLSQKNKDLKWYEFWPTIKGLCHLKISLFWKKLWKKISEGSFLKEKYCSEGCNEISLKSHNSSFTCRSQKRFSLFYSPSKALSNDVSLTLKLKTAFNPYWWRQPLWSHNWTFCVKQKLNIIWSTIVVVYLARLVEKWNEM